MNVDNKKKITTHEWFASGNAHELYPALLYKGDFIFSDGSKLYIPVVYPFANTWGEAVSMHILDEEGYPAPASIDIKWLSLIENQFYSLKSSLPQERIDSLLAQKDGDSPKYNFIVAGMGPYGGLAVWLVGATIATEVAWLHAEKIDVSMKDFSPSTYLTREEYVNSYLNNCKYALENFKQFGLPDQSLFERYMQRFNYKITPVFDDENAVFQDIELYYYNGEFDMTNSGEHAINAMRAKPYKLVIRWDLGRTKYDGYFWTYDDTIVDFFNQFYNGDVKKEGNLIVQIGKSNKDFKFYLLDDNAVLQNNNTVRQDDNNVVEIPLDDIQIIVFKNRYESFRSENYDKPPQGWSR